MCACVCLCVPVCACVCTFATAGTCTHALITKDTELWEVCGGLELLELCARRQGIATPRRNTVIVNPCSPSMSENKTCSPILGVVRKIATKCQLHAHTDLAPTKQFETWVRTRSECSSDKKQQIVKCSLPEVFRHFASRTCTDPACIHSAFIKCYVTWWMRACFNLMSHIDYALLVHIEYALCTETRKQIDMDRDTMRTQTVAHTVTHANTDTPTLSATQRRNVAPTLTHKCTDAHVSHKRTM